MFHIHKRVFSYSINFVTLIQNLGDDIMKFFKKPGRILLTIMIILAIVCPYRVHMYKTKIEEIQSGKLQIEDMQYAASDLHPYSAYLMAIPYIIIEVTLCSLYYVRTRDA